MSSQALVTHFRLTSLSLVNVSALFLAPKRAAIKLRLTILYVLAYLLARMRLISTDPHLRVGHFNLPSEVGVGYAILSHVWRPSGEQPYAEVHRLAHEGTKVSDPRLSTKVRECHRLARANGLRWFWVDAPCIDQTNSAELSEAISSMYEWYAQASICFVHPPDVPPDDIIRAPGSAFRRSIYFRRAWTLQELIAPRRVLFLSADWTVLGDKQELADLLEDITGINQDVLTFHRPLSEVSVAVRLSWASHRDASRLEDKVYCLMGLFDIHMTACYGEGAHKAFGRLQVKILERVCDHTLLAWAGSRDPRNPSIWPFAPSPEAFTREFRLVAVDMRRFVESIRHLCSVSYPGQPVSPFAILYPGLVIDGRHQACTVYWTGRPSRFEMSLACSLLWINAACRVTRLPGRTLTVDLHRARFAQQPFFAPRSLQCGGTASISPRQHGPHSSQYDYPELGAEHAFHELPYRSPRSAVPYSLSLSRPFSFFTPPPQAGHRCRCGF